MTWRILNVYMKQQEQIQVLWNLDIYPIYVKECKIMNSQWGMKIHIYFRLEKNTTFYTFLKNHKTLKPLKIQKEKSISLNTSEMHHHLNFSQNCLYSILIPHNTKKQNRDETRVERESGESRIQPSTFCSRWKIEPSCLLRSQHKFNVFLFFLICTDIFNFLSGRFWIIRNYMFFTLRIE